MATYARSKPLPPPAFPSYPTDTGLDSDDDTSLSSPVDRLTDLKNLLAEQAKREEEEDAADVDREVERMRKEARGEKPSNEDQTQQPVQRRGVYGRPKPTTIPSTNKPTDRVPSPVPNPTSSLTSLSSLPPTSQSKPPVSDPSFSEPSPSSVDRDDDDEEEEEEEEEETYPVRPSGLHKPSTASHRRRVVRDLDDDDGPGQSTPKSNKGKGRQLLSSNSSSNEDNEDEESNMFVKLITKPRSRVLASSPLLRSPQPINQHRLVLSDDDGSTPAAPKTTLKRRGEAQKDDSDRKSSEDIDEFVSSPSASISKGKGIERQYAEEGIVQNGQGEASGSEEDTGAPRRSKIKPLTRKELEEMRKETSRMNRERKSIITRPEPRPQSMDIFLSKINKDKKTRAVKPQKPLNITRQFLLPTQPSHSDISPIASHGAQSSLTTFNSEDSILPASPPSESHPLRSKPQPLNPQFSLDDSLDEEFADVDTLFAQAAAKQRAHKAAEEDLKRHQEEESQKQKAAEEELREQDRRAEKIRRFKEKFVQNQAAESKVPQEDMEVEQHAVGVKVENRDYSSLLSRGKTPVSSGPSNEKRLPSLAPTESQVAYAGRTFGHGTNSPSTRTLSGQRVKPHHTAPVTQKSLNQKLLDDAAREARRERQAKEAKFGRGREIQEKETLNVEILRKKIEERNAKGLNREMSDDEGQEEVGEKYNEEEDEDWNPHEEMEEDLPETADQDSDSDFEEEEDQAGRLPKPKKALVDQEDEIPEPEKIPRPRSEEPGDEPESDKENSLPSGMVPLEDGDEEEYQLPPSSQPLSERNIANSDLSQDEDEDEEDLPRAPKSSRRRTILPDDDDEEDDGTIMPNGQRPSLTRPLQPLSSLASSPSLLPGATLSPRKRTQNKTVSFRSHGSEAGLEPDVDESFGGEGGFSQLFQNTQAPTEVSEESQSGEAGFAEGGFSQLFQNTQASGPSQDAPGFAEGGLSQLFQSTQAAEPPQATGGFGEGGFSQLFTSTQVPTVVSGGDSQSVGGFDLGNEDSGVSQFFGDSQAPTVSTQPALGGLDQLRNQGNVLMPQASFLPSVEVSETQAMRDAEIVALNNLPELQREPSQAPKRYINKDGFFTQHKPTDSPTADTPFKSTDHAWETSSVKTPLSPSRLSSRLPASFLDSNASSSPSRTITRRLIRRQDMMLTQSEVEDVENALAPQQGLVYSSSPIKRLPPKPKADKPKRDKSTTNEFVEAEALESEDEGDGFGFKIGGPGDDEDEEGEDLDQVVEGLVDDEELTDEQRQLNDEARSELVRHQIEAEEALRLQQAQDVAAGKLRKKRKDGADLGDESDDEEKFGTSAMRKEWRRKRKLDKLDPLDALAAEPETEAFANLYQDTWKDDTPYDALLSGGEDDGSEDDQRFTQSLGIGKPRRESSSQVFNRANRRVVTSPEPMQDREMEDLPVYLDEDEDEFDSQGNSINIRRHPSRPQLNPIQHDDDFSLDSNLYSHADPNNRRSSTSNSAKRQRLIDFAKDESQNTSSAKGGSGSSVTGLKRKSLGGSTSSSSESLMTKRRIGNPLGSRPSLLGSMKGKWEK